MSVSVELIFYRNELKYWFAKMSQNFKKNDNEQPRIKIPPVNYMLASILISLGNCKWCLTAQPVTKGHRSMTNH